MNGSPEPADGMKLMAITLHSQHHILTPCAINDTVALFSGN
jgi:hypothetical protein